jgi:hypothetical protein
MKASRFSFLLLLGLFLCSCGKDSFKAEYESLVRSKIDGAGLRKGLLELDQRFPGKLRVKTDLAVLSLATADLDGAGVFLKKGETLIKQSKKDSELGYLFWAAYADWRSREKDGDGALAAAEKALALKYEDKLGVAFVKARVLSSRGKNGEALAIYEGGWEKSRKLMTREDLYLSMGLLIEAGKYREALERALFYQESFGFEAGIGVMESAILEKMGRVKESILAAFIELLFKKNLGLLTETQAASQVASIEAKLQSKEWTQSEKGAACFAALGWFMSGKMALASEAFASLGSDSGQPAFRYLSALAALGSRAPGQDDLRNLVDLEAYYKNDPGFYGALWKALRTSGSGYGLDAVAPALERAIALAPASAAAAEARIELGRLMGLSEAESRYLLTGAEIDDAMMRYASSGELSVLVPAVKALAIRNNAYTEKLESMFKGLVVDAKARLFLEDLAKGANADGLLKLRIGNILLYAP